MTNHILVINRTEKRYIESAIKQDCKIFIENIRRELETENFDNIHEQCQKLYDELNNCGLSEISNQVERIDIMSMSKEKDGLNAEIILIENFLESIKLIYV